MHVLTLPELSLPPALAAQSLALQDQAWPREPGEPAGLHDPALQPTAMLLVDEDRVLATLTILSTTIVHVGHRYRVCGLSTVVTNRADQHRGHGHRLITAAREHLAAGDADLSIFTCDRPLAAFYRRAGWLELPGTVLIGGTVENPFASDQFDKVTLADLISDRARDHAADFVNARIALYPGEIDKLW